MRKVRTTASVCSALTLRVTPNKSNKPDATTAKLVPVSLKYKCISGLT